MALSSLSVVTNANRLRRWHAAPLPAARPQTSHPRCSWVPQPKPHRPSPPKTLGGSNGPTTTVDPVCGMTIDPETAAGSREVDGVTYYFCSTHCAATFDADPARYTTASAKQ